MISKLAYPLSWPIQYPRTRHRRRSNFKRQSHYGGNHHSMDRTTQALYDELGRLGAINVILSTNVTVRLDGRPYSNQRTLEDPGVALYFRLKGRDIILPCDKWDRVECNVWAIVKHIESLRGQNRWGVGTVEQAFAGYAALPPPTSAAANCWTVLDILPSQRSRDQVDSQYRRLAQRYHPDVAGGSHEAMSQLNQARADALAQLGIA
jgi:hypothetical protein